MYLKTVKILFYLQYIHLFIPYVDTSINEYLQSYTIRTERHMKPTLFVVRGIRDERETLMYLMFISHLICQN